jgi:hypothetical protein
VLALMAHLWVLGVPASWGMIAGVVGVVAVHVLADKKSESIISMQSSRIEELEEIVEALETSQ